MSPSNISTHTAERLSSLAPIAGEKLERRLEELLHQDRFAPPASFVATERVNDASLHARAELDPNAFWAEQARTLHWDKPFTTVLDDSNPPFYKWFTDGKLNVSYNCLDRHVEAGHGDRVAFHWARRGGRAARDHLRRAASRRAAAGQRAQGAGRRQGRRGRDLPADDPRGRRRDARLRADRRAAQRRVRRLRARGGQGADGGLATRRC